MNIVILDGHTLNPGDLDWSPLQELGNLTIYDRTEKDLSLIVERCREAHILLTNKIPLSREIMEALPRLKYIGVMATGYNIIDLEAAQERGIPVSNIPYYGTDSVAQMGFAHILHFCHHLKEHSDDVKKGSWSHSKDFCYWDFSQLELAGKTLGIIGFGRIGQKMGEIARAFGMKVKAFTPRPKSSPDGEDFQWVSREELLSVSDFISLNCPLTPENKGFINKETLKKMKKSAFLINMSRGGLVVEKDLAEALSQGQIAGAGVDVLAKEPPEAHNPLFQEPNITITPHIAWATKNARERLFQGVVNNLREFLAGRPVNIVNKIS